MNNRVEYKKTFWKIYHKLGLFLNLPLDSGLSFESGGGKRWVFFWNYSIHTALQRYLFLFLFCWFIFDCVMYLMLQYKSILGKIKMLHPWKNKGAILHPYLAITATFPEPLYNSPFFSVRKVSVVEWFEYNWIGRMQTSGSRQLFKGWEHNPLNKSLPSGSVIKETALSTW